MTVFHVRLVPLRTLSHFENNEGRKTKSVSISLQDLLFMRSIKTDLSETNTTEENISFTSKVLPSPLVRCP